MFRTSAALIFGMLSVTANAGAQTQLQSLEPQVAYSAVRVLSSGKMRIESTYNYSPGKHRTVMQVSGQSMTAIIREDLDVMWSLVPPQGPMRVYMEFPMDSSEARSNDAMVASEVTESRLLGAETVGGQRTNKYEVTVREPEGATYSGNVWVTSEMIPVRMELSDPRGERFVLEQSQIEIGPQPDALFEIPAGYTKLDLGGLGATFGNLARGFEAPAPARQADEEKGFTHEVTDHATQAAKQGVLQGVGDGVRNGVGRRIRGLFGRD
jgi:hypothetical protein